MNLAKILEPGTYIFSRIFDQLHWGACFYQNSLVFTVKTGDVVFLGDLQPRINLGQIEVIAEKNGQKTAIGMTQFIYYDDIIPLQITIPLVGTSDFLAAKQYEAAFLKYLHNRLQPVVYKPGQFTRHTNLVGNSYCG